MSSTEIASPDVGSACSQHVPASFRADQFGVTPCCLHVNESQFVIVQSTYKLARNAAAEQPCAQVHTLRRFTCSAHGHPDECWNLRHIICYFATPLAVDASRRCMSLHAMFARSSCKSVPNVCSVHGGSRPLESHGAHEGDGQAKHRRARP